MNKSSALGWCGCRTGSRATDCACLRRIGFQESRMSGNLLVRFDEGRVGRTARCRPLSYSTVRFEFMVADELSIADHFGERPGVGRGAGAERLPLGSGIRKRLFLTEARRAQRKSQK